MKNKKFKNYKNFNLKLKYLIKSFYKMFKIKMEFRYF